MRKQLMLSILNIHIGYVKEKTFVFLIFLLIFNFSTTAWCSNIVYPWRSTTAIVKSGEAFEVWFNADAGQTVNSIKLKGPYNEVNVTMSIVKGNWIYDPLSGNTYNHRITVTVPAGTPADRYDVVLKTTTGDVISYGGVKVVSKYKDEYYVMHMSDGHLYQSGYNTDVLLAKKSTMIDIANIIDAQIIIETGDNMYNVRNHPEREVYYFLGNDAIGTKGMAKASAATFLTPGDHEGLNANDWVQATVQENSDFVNDYWGLQNHCFKYGNGRYMTLNNAWGTSLTSNGEHQYEVDDAKAWLTGEGSGGNFFLTAAHCYNKMHHFIHESKPLSLVLAGDKHHIYTSNPYSFTTGSAAVAYITASIRDHFAFNLFKVNNTDGTFTTPSGTTASANVLFSGDEAVPSTWVPNLKLTWSNENNGTSGTNTATIVNKFPFSVKGAKVRFVVPLGFSYNVTNGTKEQEFDGTSVHVVDVTVDLNASSTTEVSISSGTLAVNDLEPETEERKVKIYPNPITQDSFSVEITGFEKMNDVQVKIRNLNGQIVYQKDIHNPSHLEIDASGMLKKSVYVISIESGQSKAIGRFIVN